MSEAKVQPFKMAEVKAVQEKKLQEESQSSDASQQSHADQQHVWVESVPCLVCHCSLKLVRLLGRGHYCYRHTAHYRSVPFIG